VAARGTLIGKSGYPADRHAANQYQAGMTLYDISSAHLIEQTDKFAIWFNMNSVWFR
jgi:hypothetical protein